MCTLLCVCVFDVLERMEELGVSADIDTLVDYILTHVSLADPQMAVHKLQDYGLSVSMVLSPLLAVLLKAGHIQADIKLCDYILWHCTRNMVRVKQEVFYCSMRLYVLRGVKWCSLQ
jgi:hypothetical protein